MNTTLLLVAYAFPPENVTGANRPYRFYRYLPEFGISAHVITASPQDCKRPDVSFVRDEPRDFPRQGWSWHLERVVRRVLLPGEMGLTWSRKAAAQGRALAPFQGRTAVLSTSPPMSAHLAALQLKRKLRVPWIADFRDPLNPSGEITVSRTNIYSMIESFIFRETDAIIANTEAVANRWRIRYPNNQQKIHVIWNGFDPAEVISPEPIPKRDYKHIVHVGELYGGRHPELILDSLDRLTARGALASGSLRMSLIGQSSNETIPNIGVLRRLEKAGLVEYIPLRIPKQAALSIACQADALLLLQPQSNVQVPAKLFEYIRIGRPILALLPRGSQVEEILRRAGVPYLCIYSSDSVDEIDGKMLKFLALEDEPATPSAWFEKKFNARDQTRQLSAIIEALQYS